MTLLRSRWWACSLALFAMAAPWAIRARAAASSAPTVSLTRNTALNGRVWPVDLNGDGITDLVASDTFVNGSPGPILAVLGTGDGTFGSPIKSSTTGEVLAVGDFNGDGRHDVLVRHVVSSTVVSAVILPGNGDGTFAAPITVGTFADITFALTADLNGDHVTDLIICDEATLHVYPGNGDSTFGTPASIATSGLSYGGTVGDFNGDGKPDLAIANHDGRSVTIFLNTGALNFTATDISLDRRANTALAADLNHDGKLDLIVATATSAPDNPDAYVDGYAYLLFGNGDGTFAAPVKYQTAAGTWQIVVGDFTRDGIPDIATANRSAIYHDDCTVSLKTWDSVSILPGNGDGTFGSASSFSLGDQSNLTNDRYRNTVDSLNTSDLNGDHTTDLIASWGAILTNSPPDPNWAPKVTASSTQPAPGDHSVILSAPATDSDQDMLTYRWTDSVETASIAPVPIACWTPSMLGVHTYTVTVDDQHGHKASSSVTVDFGAAGSGDPIAITAPQSGETVTLGTPYTVRWTTSAEVNNDGMEFTYSTDNGSSWIDIPECDNTIGSTGQCTWNSPGPATTNALLRICDADPEDGCASTAPFTITTSSSGGTLPSGWQSADLGAVGASGGTSYRNGTFAVNGSGADIWGTADAFQYAYRQMGRQFEMQALVDSVQNVNAWTKAGIMVRTSLDPSAPQASVFVSPGHGIVFQRRTSQGGASVSTSGPPLTAPVWLRLASSYNGRIEAYYRKAITDPWTWIADDVLSGFSSSTPFVGLAVTSHANGSIATAMFEQVTYGDLPTWNGGALGVGTSGASASYDGTLFALFSQSSDVWGTADAVTFLNAAWSGDGTITARVNSVDNTSPWAKAGVMIRETDTPGSKQVFLMVTPGKGVNLQYRATTDGTSASAASITGIAPAWLRLQRSGSEFIASWSTDGVSFQQVGSVTLPMPTGVTVGLALTSHNSSTQGAAHFDDVRIDP